MGGSSNKAQAAAMAQAAEESRRARETLAAVELPDELKIQQYIDQLEAPELIGLLQAENMQDTELSGINVDPALKQQQLQLLEELKRRSEEGLNAEDKARISEYRRMSAGDEQARQASILQSMAERGISGGGNELAARLASSQASADRESQAGMQMAAQANQARMGALQGASDQAGKIRSQDYAEQESIARARDAINQFNTQNRQSVNSRNLGERQRIAEAQTGTRNLQTQQRLGQQQQSFENRYRKAGGQAQASQNLSQMYMQQAQMTPEKKGLGGAIGTIAGAGIGGYFGGAKGAQLGAQLGGVGGSQFGDGGKKYMNGGMQDMLTINADGTRMDDSIKEQQLMEAAKGPSMDYGAIAQAIGKNLPSTPSQQARPQMSQGRIYNLNEDNFANGGAKMAYNDGGEGTIIDSGLDMYAGDQLPDSINDGEIVLNVKQQDEMMKLLQDYKRLKQMHEGVEKGKRVDDQLMSGELEVDPMAQEALMSVARGEMYPEELPEMAIIKGRK